MVNREPLLISPENNAKRQKKCTHHKNIFFLQKNGETILKIELLPSTWVGGEEWAETASHRSLSNPNFSLPPAPPPKKKEKKKRKESEKRWENNNFLGRLEWATETPQKKGSSSFPPTQMGLKYSSSSPFFSGSLTFTRLPPPFKNLNFS